MDSFRLYASLGAAFPQRLATGSRLYAIIGVNVGNAVVIDAGAWGTLLEKQTTVIPPNNFATSRILLETVS